MRFATLLTEPFSLPCVKTLKQGTYRLKLEFDSREMPVEQVVQQVMANRPTQDITLTNLPPEEIIREIYRQ